MSAEDSQSDSDNSTIAPISDDRKITLTLRELHPHLVCGLCKGYFRTPYTITECLHTFCKSCIFQLHERGARNCPTCNAATGDVNKGILLDYSLQELLAKILPQIEEADREAERQFYEALSDTSASGGVGKRARSDEGNAKKAKKKAKTEIEIKLAPLHKYEWFEIFSKLFYNAEGDKALPPLAKPFLKTSHAIPFTQLLKYISTKIESIPVEQDKLALFHNEIAISKDHSTLVQYLNTLPQEQRSSSIRLAYGYAE